MSKKEKLTREQKKEKQRAEYEAMSQKEKEFFDYNKKWHTIGRIWNTIGILLIIAVPFVVCFSLKVTPNWTVFGIVGYVISNFLSHTSAANLLLPILTAIAVGAMGTPMGDQLELLGGVQALLIGLAISTSVAMILPISTPPNAIASSTGLIETKDMAKVGILFAGCSCPLLAFTV